MSCHLKLGLKYCDFTCTVVFATAFVFNHFSLSVLLQVRLGPLNVSVYDCWSRFLWAS